MAEVKTPPTGGSGAAGAGAVPSPIGGVSAPKAASKSRMRRVARAATKAVETVGPLVPGGWGKAAALLAGAAGTLIEKKMAQPAGQPAAADPVAAQSAQAPASGGTEAKLTALMGGGGAPSPAASSGAVAVGSKLIGGVLVTPEPYDSETGTRLAVAARVYGAANALELAVARLIDLPAGQLLTFVMNRGYR